MSNLNFDVFEKGMAMLCVVVNREPTEILLSTYYSVLKDLDDESFMSAVTNVLASRKYTSLATPADIREFACGKVDDEAVIALAKLERAMPTWGAYRSIIFDDPIIHAIVQSMGGWVKVCTMPAEEWKFRRIEFVKVYKAFAPNLNRLQIPLKLVGIDESSNPTLPPKIVYIGNMDVIDAWQLKIGANPERKSLAGAILKELGLIDGGTNEGEM